MDGREPFDVALDALRAGRSRGAVLAALRGLGLERREADRVFHLARTAHLKDGLPGEWRKAGRKHAVIGLVALAFSCLLVLLAAALVRAMYFTPGEKPLNGDMNVIWVSAVSLGCVGLSIGELAYARRVLRQAREADKGE
jgi:hypothetical protein